MVNDIEFLLQLGKRLAKDFINLIRQVGDKTLENLVVILNKINLI